MNFFFFWLLHRLRLFLSHYWLSFLIFFIVWLNINLTIVIIDNRMSSGSMSVILMALLLSKGISLIAFIRRPAISVAKCQVEYVFLYLLDNLFQIRRLIFNYQLILLDL